jgi:uncharacterized protein YxeA
MNMSDSTRLSLKDKRAAATIAIIILIVLAIFAAVKETANYFYKKNHCTAQTTGIIAEVKLHTDEYSSDRSYIKYSVNGKEYTLKLFHHLGDKEGQKLTVHYDPNKPETAYIGDSPTDKKSLLLAGISFMIFMSAFVIYLKKAR